MKALLHALILTVSSMSFAQVGIGIAVPNASAELEVKSTTRGFLPPRMDSAQRNAIVAPANGLVIYNTTIKAFQCYNGTEWYSAVHYIGEPYGQGIIFYVYDNGQHGLVAAAYDQSLGIKWSAGTLVSTMALTDGVGAGLKNTAIIIASQGYGDGALNAARVCNEYSVIYNGLSFGDWYLPSKYELNLLYLQKNIVGGFVNDIYWTSEEVSANGAWVQNFTNGNQISNNKNNLNYVRAIRAF